MDQLKAKAKSYWRLRYLLSLTGLAAKNLSDEKSGRIIEILFYDHPPISKRIEFAKNLKMSR